MKNSQTNSRQTNAIINSIRSSISTGEMKEGAFLPTIRELGKDFNISFETARRGLLILAEEGLIKSIPRQGFQIIGNEKVSMHLQKPLAYIARNKINDLNLSRAISHQINIQATNRSWSVFNRITDEYQSELDLHELKDSGVWGILLDSDDEYTVQKTIDLNLPTILINSWFEDYEINAVIQDNYLGGYQAGKWLIEEGAKEILWVGPQYEYIHSRERYAGFLAAFHQLTGKAPSLKVISPITSKDFKQELSQLFKSKKKPEGVFSYGINSSSIISKILIDQDIKIDKDIKLIGWTVEELFESSFAPLFLNSKIQPPAITWKVDEMINKAMSFLEQIKNQKENSSCRICIPTRIQFPEGEQKGYSLY